MSDKAIVPVSAETWQVIQSVAPVAKASRMFGVTQEQAAIVMLMGHELGLGLATAFEFVHVIDQKPSLSPKGALAMIHSSDELVGLKIDDMVDDKGDPSACRVWMKRKNGFEYSVTFTMDDAKRAGVVKDKSGWEKYPANMLRWRAVGYCADVVFPDVVGGLYRVEELGADVDADGEPVQWTVIADPQKTAAAAPKAASKATKPKVEAAPEPAPVAKPDNGAAAAKPEPVAQPEPEQPREITIQDILDAGYSAEQIMVANEGRIPATSDECAVVMEKLESGDA